jgi:hypothetical protein
MSALKQVPFTKEEIKYLYERIYSMTLVDMKATAIYGGSDIEELKPLYLPFLKLASEGMKTGVNNFEAMILDCEAIEATKPANFSPFKVRTYSINN